MTMKQITIFTLACLIGIVGCSKDLPTDRTVIKKENTLFGLVNLRAYLNGNIKFTCRPINNGNNYSALYVGHPSQPYIGKPALRINLPDGTLLDLSASNVVQVLKQKLGREGSDCSGTWFCDIGGPFRALHEKWPSDTHELQFENRHFYVHGDQLIAFMVWFRDYEKEVICDTTTYADGHKTVERRRNYGAIPTIGKSNEAQDYAFPLNQKQVIHVLGNPDKIVECFDE